MSGKEKDTVKASGAQPDVPKLSQERKAELRKLVRPTQVGNGWYSHLDGQTVGHMSEDACLRYFNTMRGIE